MAGDPSDFSDDFALMQAIVRRDRAALSELYDRHAPMLLAVCRRILKNTDDADEVLTDIFFEVWSKPERFDAGRGNPLTYLVTLARSRSIDRCRSRGPRSGTLGDCSDCPAITDSAATPVELAQLQEQRRQVREAVAALDPAQREVLECSFYEGLSHSEIAAKLNRPLGTVKTYIRQGFIQLRERLRITQ